MAGICRNQRGRPDSDTDIQKIKEQLQKTVNIVSNWADNNEFKFLGTKTTMISFNRGAAPVITQTVKVRGGKIPVIACVRFLNWIALGSEIKLEQPR